MTEVKLQHYNIILSDAVLKILSSFRQIRKSQNEAGGILLGQIVGNNIYVLKASIPSKFDKATRYSFIRDKDIAQIIVDYEFHNSDRKTIYLGEWHTHPENTPIPSSQDKRMIGGQKKSGKLNESFLLLIIQGIKGIYVGLCNGETLEQHNLVDA